MIYLLLGELSDLDSPIYSHDGVQVGTAPHHHGHAAGGARYRTSGHRFGAKRRPGLIPPSVVVAR